MLVLVSVLTEVKILINSGLATFNWSSASKEKASWIVESLKEPFPDEDLEADDGEEASSFIEGPQEEADDDPLPEFALPPKAGKATSSSIEGVEGLEPICTFSANESLSSA